MLDQSAGDLFEITRIIPDTQFAGPLEIGFDGGPEQRGFRFQGIDGIEGPQDRKCEIGVMHPVGDRLGKRLSQFLDQLLVGSSHDADIRGGRNGLAEIIGCPGGDETLSDSRAPACRVPASGHRRDAGDLRAGSKPTGAESEPKLLSAPVREA